jgi:hypothetical protein
LSRFSRNDFNAMIIYNITSQVSWNIHDHWREWVINQEAPAFVATGVFSHYQFVRLLDVDDYDGPTYALQLYINENSSIDLFRRIHLDEFENNEKALWGDEVFSFTSLMEVIN